MSSVQGRSRRAAFGAAGVLASVLVGCGGGAARVRPSGGSAAPVTPPTIDAQALFSDQGTLFDSAPEPTASEVITVTLRTAHGNVTGATLLYIDTSDGSTHSVPMTVARTDPTGAYDDWQGTIPAGASPKHYRFAVTNGAETLWYNADGASATEPTAGDFLVVPGFKTPDWMKSGVMYQIFVDRFYDGDPANDVTSGQYVYNGCATEQHAWGTSVFANVSGCNAYVFFGGDLAGIDQNLGYIKNTLGANILYLTPIFRSPSNHKYDTADYYRVDPAFGSASDLERLIEDVHGTANGPPGYIILDGVFNHSGDTNCWFGRSTYAGYTCAVAGADQSQSSQYYSWYSFQNWPTTYSMFPGAYSMPKLDYGASGSAVREQIYAGPDSVVRTYLRAPYGVDGWRLDSAQMLDAGGGAGSDATNHQIMRELRTAVTSVNPDAEILGEDWGDASAWLDDGTEWDGAMNYNGFTDPVSEWLCGVDESGHPAAIGVSQLDAWLRAARADLPVGAAETMTNELGTHDTPRFTTRCGGDLAKTELAMVLEFTYVGTPTVYYGDEYGMQGSGDPDDRRTFDWSQATPANPPVALVQKLIAIRKRYGALTTGSFLTLITDDADRLYAYGRFDAAHRIAVVLNAGATVHTLQLPVGPLGILNGSSVTDLLSGTTYTASGGTVGISLPPESAVILEQ